MVGPIRKNSPAFSDTFQPVENKNRLHLPAAADLPTHLPEMDKFDLKARKEVIASFKKFPSENHPHLEAMQLLLDQKSALAKVRLIAKLLTELE